MEKREALLCAEVAQATYGKQANVESFQLSARFENKGTDTQGMFGVAHGDTLVVAFRGSEETGIADWITDLKFVQQVFPYGEGGNKKVKVHYGFIQAYKSVRDAVLNEARNTPYKKVICTGHSLGAALATLAALDIRYNFPDKEVRCYTFGSPKVGNKDFAKSYNKRVPETYRFVNGSDTVPNIPPGSYRHVGKKEPVGDTKKKDWKAIASKVIQDHFPYNYVEALKKSV